MEQLIFVAIFLLAGLGDLLIRWLRKKEGGRDPKSRDELVILEDAEAVPDEEEEVWFEPRPMERPPEPVKAEPPLIRALSLEEIAARHVAVPAVQSRAVRTAPLPARRARPRRWIAGPVSARQGIVAMTILGRCRGLE